METDEQRIAQLRSNIARLNQEEAKAEVAREEARKQKEAALKALVEEFQVESEAAGKQTLEQLRAELTKEISSLETTMEKLDS